MVFEMMIKDLVFSFNGWGGIIIISLAGILSIWYVLSGFSKEDIKELFKAALECKFKICLVLIIGLIMMLSISRLALGG